MPSFPIRLVYRALSRVTALSVRCRATLPCSPIRRFTRHPSRATATATAAGVVLHWQSREKCDLCAKTTPPPPPARTSQLANSAWTRSVHLDAPGQRHGQQPVSGTADPGVKQDKSSRGSVDTTKTRLGPQRVRMSSGERPIGAAKGKQSDTEALCQPPPTPPRMGEPRMIRRDLWGLILPMRHRTRRWRGQDTAGHGPALTN